MVAAAGKQNCSLDECRASRGTETWTWSGLRREHVEVRLCHPQDQVLPGLAALLAVGYPDETPRDPGRKPLKTFIKRVQVDR